jgi:uncharacterized protein YdeI (YjbR/CyaY-like superfamily)
MGDGPKTLDHLPRIEIDDLSALDSWLESRGSEEGAHWLIHPKKHPGSPGITWTDIVDVLLCHGWIDSLPRKLDATRTMLLISPRRSGSGWSAINRAKVERLIAAGRMRAGGLRVVAAARQRGDWDKLDGIDPDTAPEDLARALAADDVARTNFDRIPRSSRRAIFEWIVLAKRSETRSDRVARTVSLAREGRMANHPAGRDRIPRRG